MCSYCVILLPHQIENSNGCFGNGFIAAQSVGPHDNQCETTFEEEESSDPKLLQSKSRRQLVSEGNCHLLLFSRKPVKSCPKKSNQKQTAKWKERQTHPGSVTSGLESASQSS